MGDPRNRVGPNAESPNRVEGTPEPLSDAELGGWMLVAAQFLALVSIAILGAGAWPFSLLSWALLTAGTMVFAWSLASLGPATHVHPEPNRKGLRTGGPYAYIRHPMYLGLLLAASGICASAKPMAWAFFGFLALVLTAKIFTEEGALARIYPDYAEYRRRTKRLIPFVF